MRPRLTAITICSSALLLGWLGLRSATPDSERGILPTVPATPYVRFTPNSSPIATAVLVHGLNSNKEFMQSLGMALADAGVETYAVDLPGHGDSAEGFTYPDSRLALEAVLDRFETVPVVIGHSMGGALLTDLAPSRKFETMLLLSPAPISVEDFPIKRLLVVTGKLEAPRVNQFVPRLLDAAGGETLWWKFPYAAHSSALFAPSKIRQIVEWTVEGDAHLGTIERYGWMMLMALGGMGAPMTLRWKPRQKRTEISSAPVLVPTLAGYVAVSGTVVLLLRFVNPMGWLGVFAADYLIGFILIVGLLLWRGRLFSVTRPGIAIGLFAAIYVIGIVLVGVVSHLVHLVPAGSQWLWFPVLTLAGLPLSLHDEITLRPIPAAWKRWGAFLLTRMILWSAVVTGVLLLNLDDSFLVLIMHLVVLFWLLLWWMTGLVARRTGEAGAAALFAAIVQGWVFASLMVRV